MAVDGGCQNFMVQGSHVLPNPFILHTYLHNLISIFCVHNLVSPCPVIKLMEGTRLLVHVINANANCPSVSLELFYLGQLHHGHAHIPQTFGRQVCAGDVLNERPEVDAGVLLGVSIGCCIS